MSKARELSKLLSGTLKVGALQAPAGTTAQRPNGQVGQIRYNSTIGKNEMMDSEGWTAVASPPQITSVSPSTYNGEQGSSFTINGAFFDTGATVKFITNAGTEYSAATVSRVSASQLIATTPQDFTVAQEPLKVKVLNPSGLNYTLDAAIDCGGVPTWNTAAGNLATVIEDEAISSIQLSAGDPDVGATISYVLQNGNNLPTGLVLSSAGLITGTPNVNDAYSTGVTHNFTVNAMDNAGNVTPRLFNIIRKWRDGSTASLAGTSAAAIKAATGLSTNGTYWINIAGIPTQLYCDMTTSGGGWMSFASIITSSWFGGNTGADANWSGLNYSYGTYSNSGNIGDYWRNYSQQSVSDILMKTGNNSYWIHFKLSDVYHSPNGVSHTVNAVATSNNFSATQYEPNTKVTIMHRSSQPEDPWINAGNTHANGGDSSGTDYMFWGETGGVTHGTWKNSNGGIIVFVR